MSDIRTQALESNDVKTVVGRLLPGAGLLPGIEKVCLDNGITNGVVVSMIGSLKAADIVYAVDDPTNKIGIKYSDTTTIEGPLELLCCQGMIGLTPENKLSIHLHGLFSDPSMKVFGGHFVETGNIVLATVEFMIKQVKDIEMTKALDDETGFPLIKFNRKK